MSFHDAIMAMPGLTAYMPLNSAYGAKDIVNNTDGIVHGNVAFKADGAHFSGGWIEFPDAPYFSPAATGTKQFTVLCFQTVDDWTKGSANNEYVNWLGKGNPTAGHEWTFRYYIDGGGGEAPARKRRTSIYSFNAGGNLGTGSYFQDLADGNGVERFIAGSISTEGTGTAPGIVQIFKNAVLRDADLESTFNVTPTHTRAPLGIGSRGDGTGFLYGRLTDVAFFNRTLTAADLQKLYDLRGTRQAVVSIKPQAVMPPPVTVPLPGLTVTKRPTTVVINGYSHVISGFDRARGTNELIVYTPAFGARTGTNRYGTEASVVGGKVTLLTVGAGDSIIPLTGFVLSGHGTAGTWLRAHAPKGASVALR